MDPSDPLADLWVGIESFDEDLADRALVGLLWDLPLPLAVGHHVVPFLDELGRRWQAGTVSIAQEHFASEVLRRRLGALSRQHELLPVQGRRRPRALLACPPGERHDLVLLCFGLLLGERGWRTTFLGADTPVQSVAEVARASEVDAVVLATRRSDRLTAHRETLVELAGDHRLYVAGRGADEEVARVLAAHLLPSDVVAALDVVVPRPSRPADRVAQR